MKRLVSMILCVVLVICSVPIVFADANSKDFSIEIISGKYDAEKGGYAIDYEVLNGGDESLERTVIIGAFDDSGELISVQSENIALDSGAKKHKIAVLYGAVEEFENAVLKVFLWENLDNIRPISTVCKIAVSDLAVPHNNVAFNFADEEYMALGMLEEPTELNGLSFNKLIGGKDLGIHENGSLNLWGGGNTTNCSVDFHVEGDCRIRVWAMSHSSTEARTIKIFNESNDMAYIDAPCGEIKCSSFDYEGSANDIYVASRQSGIFVYRIEVLYSYDDDEKFPMIEEKVEDFGEFFSAVRKAELYGGGTIVINSDVIEIGQRMYLSNKNENPIIIRGGEGYKAILDFDSQRKSVTEEESTRNGGIYIKGSNYHIKDIIVQKAAGTGIAIGGETGCNNTVENVVSRYNNGMGFNTHNGASNNTFKNCYAYRNCDVLTKGQNADGIGIMAYSGIGNKLIDCYSWENADDGFDSFNMFNDVTYENCFAWRNGNADVFSGKIDFDNGKPLDMNLHLVEKLCEYDPTFKERYESGVFELPEGEFLRTTEDTNYEIFEIISAADFVGSAWRGNPNGLKLGSGSSATTERPQVGPEAVRTMTNCIAFDHKSKGFDRNNANCTVYINNGLSFDNDQLDYWLETCTLNEFNNAYSGTASEDNRLPSGYSVNHLSDEKLGEVKEFLNGRIAQLEEMVNNDEIPHGICLEDVFELLNEE